MALTRIRLEQVTYVPRQLAEGTLYVSAEYKVAVHLCACGCGNKVTTPLGPVEWSFREHNGQATLTPSVGNWQLPCRSHYVIKDGNILWAGQFTEGQILAGRHREQQRRVAYYRDVDARRGWWQQAWEWLLKLFGRG